ncbi:MAG: LysM peptidoglycan-binding domain-containing protein [Bacillota bacterium]
MTSLIFRLGFLFILLVTLLFSSTFAYASDYTVVPGDTVYLIGQRYHIAADEIKKANNLKDSFIYPGQKLIIPDRLHTVRQGDSLYLIGLGYNVSYKDIISANGLKSDVIYPGQVLRVPAAEVSVSRGGVLLPGRYHYTAGDLDLLARLITAEADSESYLTKVAVGAVVLNRVQSPLFPDTISKVIYQADGGIYQFEPVKNGWISRAATPDSIRAAKEALGGGDPTGGALYFFESWVPNRFLRSLPVSVVLDSFTFAFSK